MSPLSPSQAFEVLLHIEFRTAMLSQRSTQPVSPTISAKTATGQPSIGVERAPAPWRSCHTCLRLC